MEIYPKNQLEMEKQFATDEQCRSYLYSIRWPNGFVCPKCKSGEGWNTNRGLVQCKKCRYQSSVIAGTIFQDSKLPLTLWFRAIWHLTSQKHGANALGIQRILGLGSYETAWVWLQKLRRAMVRPGRDRLTGKIEVDESYIGGEKTGKRGRGSENKALVLIAAQHDGNNIGRIRLMKINNASGACLEASVLTMIEPESTIQTDGWGGYSRLKQLGYIHEILVQDENTDEAQLPRCHRIASLLKRWILGIHQGAISHKHLPYYLDEYTFRFNRRTSNLRGKLFYRLIQQAVQISPQTYEKLIS